MKILLSIMLFVTIGFTLSCKSNTANSNSSQNEAEIKKQKEIESNLEVFSKTKSFIENFLNKKHAGWKLKAVGQNSDCTPDTEKPCRVLIVKDNTEKVLSLMIVKMVQENGETITHVYEARPIDFSDEKYDAAIENDRVNNRGEPDLY